MSDTSIDRHATINRPEVVAELRAIFDRYEEALLANDLEILDELFWNDPRVVRYGPEGQQYGAEAVSTLRRSLVRQTLPRRLSVLHLTTFGNDLATVWVEFMPDGKPELGRQSQTWVRFPEGWRVVAAHVSWLHGVAPAS